MFRDLILFAAVFAVAIATSKKIDPTLAKKLDSKTNVNVVINFVGGNSQAIQETKSRSFQNRAHRINSLVSSLQSHTHRSQKNVLTFLKSQPVKYKSFWISNQIYVFSANKKLVEYLAKFSEVISVEEERNAYIEPPQARTNSSSKVEPGWNIKKIQANEAWQISDGSGVVVGNTDSGVRYTHEALRDNYRHEYGWFDAYDGTAIPTDHQGHGTHTMGTIAGSLGIGVAPGVKWIACKGCDDNLFCTGVVLTACGQWMLCPNLPDGSNPDCSMAPNLVSNSWGYNVGNDPYYERIVEAWIAAGIMPIFAIGNEGPECETVRSPGDYARVIGVGATTDADATTDFSSIGPTIDGRIKPDVSAPGKDVRSSVNGSDTAYGYWWGTSMATPHVAGVTALLLSVRPDLGFEEVRSILLGGVDTGLSSEDKVCGGITDKTFPNNHFGYGRINALKVLLQAVGSCKRNTCKCSQFGMGKCAWDNGEMDSLLPEEYSFALPVNHLPRAVQKIKQILQTLPAAFPLVGIYIRFSKRSDAYMSIGAERDTVVIDWATPMRSDPFENSKYGLGTYQAMSQALIFEFDGRPHWGKNGQEFFTRQIIQRRPVELLDKFRNIMDKYDPNGIFMNHFGKRLQLITDILTVPPEVSRCALQDYCTCRKDGDCASEQYCGTALEEYTVCMDEVQPLPVIPDENEYDPLNITDIVRYFMSNGKGNRTESILLR